MPDMGLDDGAGAHVAWLQGHIQVAVEEVPGGELPAGLGDTDHLGVKSCILLCLTEIVCSCYDLSVFNNDCTDR